MSKTTFKNKKINPENKKSSEEKVLAEEIRNLQNVDIFKESETNWC